MHKGADCRSSSFCWPYCLGVCRLVKCWCTARSQEEEQEAAAAKEEAIRKEEKSRKRRAARANRKNASMAAGNAHVRMPDAAKFKASASTTELASTVDGS